MTALAQRSVRRICYFIPGPMSQGPMGPAEVRRRLEYLRRHAPADVEITIRETAGGPTTIECERDEARAVEAIAEALPSLADSRFDAVIMGCFGDPALQRVRDRIAAPVIGPAAASFRAARGRFAVITIDSGVVAMLTRLARRYDCAQRLAGVLSIDVPVLELRERPALVRDRVLQRGRSALEAGATTLVLGCMTMGFLDLAGEIEKELDAPVINPVDAALATAVASARSRLALA